MRIRAVTPDEWEALRELRLRALLDAPEAFGGTYEGEIGLPRSAWLRWITGEGSRTPGVTTTIAAEEDGRLFGMVSGSQPHDGPEQVEVHGLWVDPAVRGSGASGRLMAAVTDWARERGATSILLSVADGNEIATAFYRRRGFVPAGRHAHPLREGSQRTCTELVLHLR